MGQGFTFVSRKPKMASNLTKNCDPTLYSAFNLRNLMEKGVANPNRLNGNAAGAKQDNEKKEETDEVWSYLEAQAAFLGPSLWDNGDLKMEYMDLDEFLSENGIPVKDNGLQGRSPQQQGPSNNQSNNDANDPVLARASSSSNVSGNATPTRSVPSSPAVTAVNEDDENSVSGCSSSSMLDAISPATCTSLRSTPAKRKRNTVSIA